MRATSYLNDAMFGVPYGLSLVLMQPGFGIPVFSRSIVPLLGWTVVGLNVGRHVVGTALAMTAIRKSPDSLMTCLSPRKLHLRAINNVPCDRMYGQNDAI